MTDQLINILAKAILGGNQQFQQAHAACIRYKKTDGKPLETGNNIRCLFSMGESSGLATDKFKFVEGAVYVVTGTVSDSRDRMVKHMTESGMDISAVEYMLSPERNPHFYMARRRNEEGEVLITYPGYPGVILDVVMDGAADESQRKDIHTGETFTPEHLTCLAQDITMGKTYKIIDVLSPCSCDDDDCPAKDVKIATFIDDAGDEAHTEIPFGPLGTFRIID